MFVDSASFRAPERLPVNGSYVNASHVSNGHVSERSVAPDVPTNVRAASGLPRNDPFDDVDPAVAERLRLETELADVKQRIVDARSLMAERQAAISEALRVELESSRDAIAELERRHADAVSTVRTAGRSEVDAILTEARRRAASVLSVPTPNDSTSDLARGTQPDAS